MAYVTPGTVAAGDVATAAAWNVLTNDILQFAPFVQGVFTNEAARDAAITSPTEGMHVYLTAPTVPAATGAITFVPGGVETIYNGSVWVCVTEVGARSESNTTSTQTSYSTTVADGSTALSVSLVTGTTALVGIGFSAFTNGGEARACAAVSGATTIAASNARSITHHDLTNAAANIGTHSAMVMYSGLTAGTNTFTLQYKFAATAGGSTTINFVDGRYIWAKGIA